jgi:hypothetical protein
MLLIAMPLALVELAEPELLGIQAAMPEQPEA